MACFFSQFSVHSLNPGVFICLENLPFLSWIGRILSSSSFQDTGNPNWKSLNVNKVVCLHSGYLFTSSSISNTSCLNRGCTQSRVCFFWNDWKQGLKLILWYPLSHRFAVGTEPGHWLLNLGWWTAWSHPAFLSVHMLQPLCLLFWWPQATHLLHVPGDKTAVSGGGCWVLPLHPLPA